MEELIVISITQTNAQPTTPPHPSHGMLGSFFNRRSFTLCVNELRCEWL